MDDGTATLTVARAAARAGVSKSLVYAWCADGTLPHLRVGRAGKRGKVLVRAADLDAVLAGFRVRAGRPPPAPPLVHIRLD